MNGDTADTEFNDLNTAPFAPLSVKHLIENFSNLHSMSRQGIWTNLQFRNLGKGGLQCRQKFGFKLAVNLIASIALSDVATDIAIEFNRIDNPVAVLTEAANRKISIKTDISINGTKWNR